MTGKVYYVSYLKKKDQQHNVCGICKSKKALYKITTPDNEWFTICDRCARIFLPLHYTKLVTACTG